MSPRSREKNEEIRQQSIKRITDAAFQLFARQGYESTTIAQIADKAKVSKGLLYNYFKNKEDLLERIIANAAIEAEDAITELISDDPAKTLENFIRYVFNELRERSEYFRILFELSLKIERFGFAHNLINEKFKAQVKHLETLLRQIHFPEPAAEAKLIAALVDGIGLQLMVLGKDYPLDEIEKILIDKYCKRKNK